MTKSCFVLMPFRNDLRPIYNEVFKLACEDQGLRCSRVDDEYAPGPITRSIVNGILGADLLIADLTDRNANVLYELGIAHAAGKRTILVAQRKEDLPFDVSIDSVIFYPLHGTAQFRQMLGAALRSILDQDYPTLHPVRELVVQRETGGGAIVGTTMSAARDLTDELLAGEADVDILLKDGRTFFSKKARLLAQRFSTPNRRTNILVVHPDYTFIDAVAGMDPEKAQMPRKQREDGLFAIAAMRSIRDSLEPAVDVETKVGFWGYRAIPTWSGFITAERAIVHPYYTHPFRGELNALVLHGRDARGVPCQLYEGYRTDYDELLRGVAGSASLWNDRFCDL